VDVQFSAQPVEALTKGSLLVFQSGEIEINWWLKTYVNPANPMSVWHWLRIFA
jgi:hypothetical protein